jgi:hypothetical protein
MNDRATLLAAAVLAALASAGGTRAQTASPSAGVTAYSATVASFALASIGLDDMKPALDLTDHRSFQDAPPVRGGAASAPDPMANKTAIDHRFESADAVGAVGYLCGLQPGPNETAGPASTFDPAGTFLGAQLNLAFR